MRKIIVLFFMINFSFFVFPNIQNKFKDCNYCHPGLVNELLDAIKNGCETAINQATCTKAETFKCMINKCYKGDSYFFGIICNTKCKRDPRTGAIPCFYVERWNIDCTIRPDINYCENGEECDRTPMSLSIFHELFHLCDRQAPKETIRPSDNELDKMEARAWRASGCAFPDYQEYCKQRAEEEERKFNVTVIG